jgi:hypothetical protein
MGIVQTNCRWGRHSKRSSSRYSPSRRCASGHMKRKGKSSCTRRDGTGRSRNRYSQMPRSTVAANARDALVPVSAEAESGGGATDEGEAERAKSRQRTVAHRQPGRRGTVDGRACGADPAHGDGRESGRLIGQAQRPQLPHGQRRGNECFRLLGSSIVMGMSSKHPPGRGTSPSASRDRCATGRLD